MIDFSSLVLAPAMNTFARPATVTPSVSQPGAPAYAVRGIFTRQNIDVPVEDGIMSSATLTFDVRLAEIVQEPVPGDRLALDGVNYLIDDTDFDGNGGSRWTLKALS
jgi:hypothetical protein